MTRDLVLGLEVVLADGRIWNGLKVLRKDNRGYDLKQVFIGSEGTLGIVTAAALKLFPKPTQIETALVGLRSVEDAMALYARARRDCSDLLTAFELILRGGIEITMREGKDFPDPLDKPYPAYVLIEVSSGAADAPLPDDWSVGVADIVESGSSPRPGRAERLWLYREIMVERQGRGGRYLRTDVSVPISKLADFVTDALFELQRARPDALAVTYGHVGDGNIHLNVVPPEGMICGSDRASVRGGGGGDLCRRRPLWRLDQRRARHWPGQAEGIPRTHRSGDARPCRGHQGSVRSAPHLEQRPHSGVHIRRRL